MDPINVDVTDIVIILGILFIAWGLPALWNRWMEWRARAAVRRAVADRMAQISAALAPAMDYRPSGTQRGFNARNETRVELRIMTAEEAAAFMARQESAKEIDGILREAAGAV